MQKILVLLAFICFTLPTLSAQSARRVEVYFTHFHTKTDLMNIKAELKAQKILVDYTEMAFDNDGHLTELSFTVDCQDGFKGSAYTTEVPEDNTFGFIRDPRPNAETPLKVGALMK